MADFNATQFAGMLAFGVAALMSALASRRLALTRWHWGSIAALNGAMALECGLGVRHRVHDIVIDQLKLLGIYADRRLPQEYMIALVALLAIAIATASMIRLRHRPASLRIACFLSIAALGLFITETVSLHRIDGALYLGVGPLALIGWLWLILGTATAICASSTKN